jgi:UDP-glucuronate 4-epimerase
MSAGFNPPRRMNINLVTGAAGFIGSWLCRELLEKYPNKLLLGMDNFDNYYPSGIKQQRIQQLQSHPHFRFLQSPIGELTPEVIKQAAAGTDSVPEIESIYHLAARPGVRASFGDREGYQQNNVRELERFLENMQHSYSRFVLASSSSVYGSVSHACTEEDILHPGSPYALSKVHCEELCRREVKSELVIYRLFSVYGPSQRPDMFFQKLLNGLLEERPVPVYNRRVRRDFTFVKDIVKTMTIPLPAGTYNLGYGQPVSLDSAIRLIGELTGRHLPVRDTAVSWQEPDCTWSDTGKLHRVLAEQGVSLSWTDLPSGLEEQISLNGSLSFLTGIPDCQTS